MSIQLWCGWGGSWSAAPASSSAGRLSTWTASSRSLFDGIGSPDIARRTVRVDIEAATPTASVSTISAVSTGLRRRLRRPSER